MARICTFIIFDFIFSIFALYGQTIKGKIYSDDDTPLNGAIVNILNKKDSIFYAFSRSNESGEFNLLAPKDSGEFIVVFLYPKHADVSIPLKVGNKSQDVDLGEIRLPLNTVFLEEVIVTARSLLKVKGDTLEYDISGLTLSPNSRVEDVLEQLPGMKVTRGGQILSHGKIIERVLVDGEMFFGNDPTLVTKNIRSDMVEKIQVYDGASDRERISGIEDSKKKRTIDIKLKEDKKKGTFGLVELSYLNKRFNNVLMLNWFNGNEKIAGYGIYSNTGRLGVGYKNIQASGKQGRNFDSNTGKYTGKGKPTVYSSGLTYSNAWEKSKLNTSITLNGITVEGEETTYEFLEEERSLRNYNRENDFKNTSHSQGITLDFERNKASKVYVAFDFINEKEINKNNRVSEDTFYDTGEIRKAIHEKHYSVGRSSKANMLLNWSKGLPKDGRRISIGFEPSLLIKSSNSDISSLDKLSANTTESQLMLSEKTHENALNFIINYSEPFLNGILIGELESKKNFNGGHVDSGYVGADIGAFFDGEFSFNYKVHKGRIHFKRNFKGLKADIGSALSFESSHYKDLDSVVNTNKSYLFFQPTVNLEYQWSMNHSLAIHYEKTQAAPTAKMVQNYADAQDLLNVYMGNPELEPKTNHQLGLRYHNFKIVKLRAINAFFEYNLNKKDIGYNLSLGKGQNIIKPVNIDKQTHTYSYSASWGKEVNKNKDYLWLQMDGNHSLGYNYINNRENSLKSTLIKFQSNLSFKERKGLFLYLSVGPAFQQLSYSQNREFNFKGIGYEGSGHLDFSFPFQIRLEQYFNYTYKPHNKLIGTSLNQFLWDITLQKNFGKDQAFTLELSAFDLLNKNTGLQRMYGISGFVENNYSTIKRHFLFTFKWDFNSMGGRND